MILPNLDLDEYVTLDGKILQKINNKLHLQKFINQNLLVTHFLMEGNQYIKYENYYFKDGLAIDGLRKYFEIALNKINKSNSMN